MYVNGNRVTGLMHLITWDEINRLRVNREWEIKKMSMEQTVLVNFKHHKKPVEGKFDFLVETPKKVIGFEVLTRPSKGKIQRKMSYAEEVDQFVFVLPDTAMEKYQKHAKVPKRRIQGNFLPPLFGNPNLFVWLVDLNEKTIVKKVPFAHIFNVEKEAKRRR